MKHKPKQLTKGQITESALNELRYRGFDCWPENNIAVRRRKFTGRKGKPDIIGFGFHGSNYSGAFLGCEVKTIDDEFSDDQITFLHNLSSASGAAYVAYQAKTGQIKVETWADYLSQNPQLINRNGSKKISNSIPTKQ